MKTGLTGTKNGPYRIAYCLPVRPEANTADTSIVLQLLIASGLRVRGHKVDLAGPENLEDILFTTDFERFVTVPRSWSNSFVFRASKKVAWKAQQALNIPYLNVFSNYAWSDAYLHFLSGYDLVQERNGLFKAGAAMACRRLGLPYILFHDADDILEHDLLGLKLTGILRVRASQIIRYNLETAAHVICVSETAKNRLVKTWAVDEGKISVFPNAVDVNLHRPYPDKREETRTALGSGDAPIIIFVGSFFPWQDVELLLEAFTIILNEFPTAQLVLIGDGEKRQAMELYANQLGISRSVRFPGFLPHEQVSQMVSAADIAVAPYKKIPTDRFAGSSMKIFEYMASGTALVATRQGQIQEVISDGINGILVEPGSKQALSEAMLMLLRDKMLRDQIGQRARRDAVEFYSWDRYITRLECLYRSVLDQQTASKKAVGALSGDHNA